MFAEILFFGMGKKSKKKTEVQKIKVHKKCKTKCCSKFKKGEHKRCKRCPMFDLLKKAA